MKDAPSRDREELVLYGVIGVIGLISVIIVLRSSGVFGSQATIGLLMLVASVVGLGWMWRLARKRRSRG